MTSGFAQLETFKEISLSNAFYSELAQTFHPEFCTKSVQTNPTPKGATFHEQKELKGQDASFLVQLSSRQFILPFFHNLNIEDAFEKLVTKVAET